jgi:hypothetical protein
MNIRQHNEKIEELIKDYLEFYEYHYFELIEEYNYEVAVDRAIEEDTDRIVEAHVCLVDSQGNHEGYDEQIYPPK